MRFIIRILANSLAIYLAAYFIPGVILSGDWKTLLICGLVLSLMNMIIRPILKLISLPLIILTLGLFTLVINVIIIWLLTRFIPELIINGLLAFILTALVVAVVNSVVNVLTKKPAANS